MSVVPPTTPAHSLSFLCFPRSPLSVLPLPLVGSSPRVGLDPAAAEACGLAGGCPPPADCVGPGFVPAEESRHGRDKQRWDGNVRLCTGTVPIVMGGGVLLCSATNKNEWIVPKGEAAPSPRLLASPSPFARHVISFVVP